MFYCSLWDFLFLWPCLIWLMANCKWSQHTHSLCTFNPVYNRAQFYPRTIKITTNPEKNPFVVRYCWKWNQTKQIVVYLPKQVMGGGTHKCFGVPQTTVGTIKKSLKHLELLQTCQGEDLCAAFPSHRQERGREAEKNTSNTVCHAHFSVVIYSWL